MASVVKKLLPGAAGTAGAGAGDDDFNLVTTLLPANGSNAAQNVTFLDSSDNNLTVTAGSDVPIQGTFSPFSKDEGKWSWNWPIGGTTNKLTLSSSADFAFGTGAFTIECWVYVTADTNPYSRVWHVGPYWNDNNAIGLVVNDTAASDKITFDVYAAGGRTCVSTNVTPMNQWTHIACVRDSSGNFKLFINGNLDATNTSYTSTNISPSGNQTLAIGNIVETSASLEPEACFEGYISGLRVTKGTALYSATFDLPTSPAVYQDTNTKLLTCQSNRIKDNNTNSTKTLTMKSTVKVAPFSPFKNTAAYDPAVHGGSFLFEQNANSYLEVDHATLFDFGTADYCIESWLYPTQTSFSNSWAMWFNTKGVNQYWAYTNGGGNSTYAGFSAYPAGGYSASNAHILVPYTWNHCVFQNTGGYENWYLNGTRIYNTQNNPSLSASATGARMGNSPAYASYFYYGGYMSDLRVTTGANYNPYSNAATLTVPTAPLTKGSYTRLLLNGTNAAITDASGTNNIETVGNAQLDTSVKKFGTASAEFDHTGDYFSLPQTEFTPFGTSDFTIECWCRFDTTPAGNGQGLFQLSNGTLNTQVRGPAAGAEGNNGYWALFWGTTQLTHSTVPAINTWYHVALVRHSGTTKLHIDGTLILQVADSTNYTDTYFTVGGWYTTGYLMDGYIDDFRITHKARYTTNFTPPDKEHPTI